MLLIICASCGRRRTFERKPKGRLKCTCCGSLAVRVFRRIKTWMVIEDFDGRPDARTAVYHQLVWYAGQKGYKPGWAACKFKAIYGVWPNGEATWVDPVNPSEPPSIQLMHWINKENAAYAAQQRRLSTIKKTSTSHRERISNRNGS